MATAAAVMWGGRSTAPAGVTREIAHQYQGRVTAQVIIACIAATVGGYAIGISGGFTYTDIFLAKFFHRVYKAKKHAYENNYCKFNSKSLAAFMSSQYLAGMISSLFACPITRKYGRRGSIICGGIWFVIGATLDASAVNLAMLLSGRIMLGFGIGFAYQAVPIYLSEMSPKHIRGGLNVMFQLAITLGELTTNMVNHRTKSLFLWGWRLSVGLAAIPGIIMTIGGILIPETPNSLIECGLKDEGKRVLEKIRGTANVHAELEDITNASEVANSIENPLGSILERRNRPQLTMAILMPTFQILTGVNSLLFYAPVLFERMAPGLGPSADLTKNASLYSSALTGAVLASSTLVSSATVDRLGRRYLLYSGGRLMMICQIIVASIFGFTSTTEEELDRSTSIVAVVIICLFLAAFGWSWGPLAWTVPSEIFPLEARSAGQSITVAVNLLFSVLISQFFISILCAFEFGVFLFFAGWNAIMTIFVYLFLPETKGVPIEAMIFLWRKHWFWKRIVPNEAEDTENAIA